MTASSQQQVGRTSSPVGVAPGAEDFAAADQDWLAGTAVPRSQGSAKMPVRTIVAIPVAATIAFIIHRFVAKNQPVPETNLYSYFLGAAVVASLLATALQLFWPFPRRWLTHISPIFAAAILVLGLWELITTGFRWLPLPYFPAPPAVLQSLISDRLELYKSTRSSLALLLQGYAIGVIVAVISGVTIGWFAKARYWGMPILKIIGPIPATAWVPLAMVLAPAGKTEYSAVGLIAFAVWFPVTMLTASGISNTRASYLDVARTLGASRSYLIFRVAIPAAMPSIFIGLFMGLGTSFLTLIVAETVGVKSGLGYYVSWAQGWAEYAKVFAALVIMAAFFSTIMTILFKLRDRVLVWQKGVIKW
jgi:NitT/TauT family transport system permease protein